MRISNLLAAIAATTAGYSLGAHPVAARAQRTSIVLADEGKGLSLPSLPIRSVIIGLLTVQSVRGLVTHDLPSFSTDAPDLFATVLDGAFLGWGVTILIGQTGALKSEAAAGRARWPARRSAATSTSAASLRRGCQPIGRRPARGCRCRRR